MAKRKRNIKERQDYRQGGRVALAKGGKRGAKRKATPKIRKPAVRKEEPRPTPQAVGPSDKPITKTKPVKPTVRPSKKPVIPGNEPFPVEPPIIKDPARPRPQVPTLPPVDPTVSRPAETTPPVDPTVSRPDRPTERPGRPDRPRPNKWQVGDTRVDANGVTWILTPDGWEPLGETTPTPTPTPTYEVGEVNPDSGYVYTAEGTWVRPDGLDPTATWNVETQTWDVPKTDPDPDPDPDPVLPPVEPPVEPTGPDPRDRIVIPETPTSSGPKPVRGDYPPGPEGNQQYQAALAAWEAGAEGYTPQYADRTDEQARAAREYVQQAAEGKLPADAVVSETVKTDEDIEFDETTIPQMTDSGTAVATEATTGVAEDVSTGVAEPDVVTDRDLKADTYTGEQVSEDVLFDPAEGKINNEEDIAFLNEKSLTYLASGVDFTQEQKDRGLATEIEKATVNREAAAKVAGTDLPRMLRAKKQLRRAGLTEDQINLIGNDPDLLEDELLDYTEAERGMIAGLPDEALVSTQINALLDGVEAGEIPVFARPAVAAVNEMLAARGLSASTVGRDNLVNALIQAAMPIAQSNAQSIKESVLQQRGIEAQAEQMNAQMRQEAGQNHATRVFNMDIKKMDLDQQTELFNKQFLQTTSMTEVDNEMKATLQNAVNWTQMDVANLNTQQKLAVRNADAFLNMNLTNLNNEQQGEILKAQNKQQRILSNQSATNAARQFNSTSENQMTQFVNNLAAQVDLQNAARNDAMEQYNATQENQAEARRFATETDVSKLNAQLQTQVSQFNDQQDFQRDQWNKANQTAIMQSNVEWRRKANTINTAADNDRNRFNATNAFNMSTQSMTFMWQELRDQASYLFQAEQNQAQRQAGLFNTILGQEALITENSTTQNMYKTIMNKVSGWF
jgi:hypothetical protein